MSLLSELDGAQLVVADEDMGLLYVWYGGAIVQILDDDGNVRDTFSISAAFDRTLTTRQVRAAIEAHRNDLQEDLS